jgi:hypothetical protein
MSLTHWFTPGAVVPPALRVEDLSVSFAPHPNPEPFFRELLEVDWAGRYPGTNMPPEVTVEVIEARTAAIEMRPQPKSRKPQARKPRAVSGTVVNR